MEMQSYVPIYYDAWKNDNDEDPMYSLVYQMILETKSKRQIKSKNNFSDVLAVAGKITCAIKGIDPNEIAASLKPKDYLETIKERKDIDTSIEKFIDKLLPKGCDRLLIIIDELDRCNPKFAVNLLERIKHYVVYHDSSTIHIFDTKDKMSEIEYFCRIVLNLRTLFGLYLRQRLLETTSNHLKRRPQKLRNTADKQR